MKNSMRKGFTLVELLVVMAILAVLALLAVPRFVSIQKQANERTFLSNHKTLTSLVTLYQTKYLKAPTEIAGLEEFITTDDITTLGQTGVTFDISADPGAGGGWLLKGKLDKAQTDGGTVDKTTSFKIE